MLKKCHSRKAREGRKGHIRKQKYDHVDIHLAPPEEDMPGEAMQHSAEAVPPTESHGNLQLVMQPVVAICNWSGNQSRQSAVGYATSHGNMQLVIQSVIAICDCN